MDLLLWRHAQAVDATADLDDLQRPLTKQGEAQAAHMAAWLKRHLPANTRILCSPALRTRQTVQHLTQRNYHIDQELAPDAGLNALLHATQWPHSPTPVMVVGHQPTLACWRNAYSACKHPAPSKKARCGGCAAACATARRKWCW